MGAGDVLVIGPYYPDAAGMALLDTALTALTHTDSATDKIFMIPMINNAGVFIVNVEGA